MDCFGSIFGLPAITNAMWNCTRTTRYKAWYCENAGVEVTRFICTPREVGAYLLHRRVAHIGIPPRSLFLGLLLNISDAFWTASYLRIHRYFVDEMPCRKH